MLNRFVYWLWFGLGLSILPIGISFWILCATNPNLSYTENFSSSICKGELLIICTAILGVNIGDLFREPNHPKWNPLKFSLVGASILVSIFAGAIYIYTSVSKEPMSKYLITNTSIILLVVSLVICISSILLPKREGL